jgi:UDP-glucose 6-dehydrogenase
MRIASHRLRICRVGNGGCLASIGHDVVCNDSDEARSIYSGKGGDCQSSNQGSIRLWRRRCAKGALHSRAIASAVIETKNKAA